MDIVKDIKWFIHKGFRKFISSIAWNHMSFSLYMYIKCRDHALCDPKNIIEPVCYYVLCFVPRFVHVLTTNVKVTIENNNQKKRMR